MAPIDQQVMTVLDERELEDALALTEETGWNQLAGDWRHFFSQGRVFGLRDEAELGGDAGGRLIGSAAILPYGGDFAWISMVMVSQSHRGKGLGSSLLRHCIAVLEEMGRIPILDATPAGEKVYRRLGFQGSLRITRWLGRFEGMTRNRIAQGGEDIRKRAVALASAGFGADRGALIESFAARLPAAVLYDPADASGGELRGVVFGRDGRHASQIGPLVATSSDVALSLLNRVSERIGGPVFLDIPDACEEVVAWLKERGFEPQRSFLRMARGGEAVRGDPARVFAIAGPEFG